MRAKTKVVALSLCAVMLVAASVATTIAFLKSSDSVKNTFTVGKVSITLDEAKVNEYGQTTGEVRVKENTYKLIPGHEYTKDPTVHLTAGSEKSYLFVKVENGLSAIEDNTKIETQILANGWEKLNNVAGVYYREAEATATNADYPVFGNFTLAGNADVACYADAEIKVTAYAIQADGFTSATAAWTAGNF